MGDGRNRSLGMVSQGRADGRDARVKGLVKTRVEIGPLLCNGFHFRYINKGVQNKEWVVMIRGRS
jgi:hypothetical protein